MLLLKLGLAPSLHPHIKISSHVESLPVWKVISSLPSKCASFLSARQTAFRQNDVRQACNHYGLPLLLDVQHSFDLFT